MFSILLNFIRLILWPMIKIWFIILVNIPCMLAKYVYSALLSEVLYLYQLDPAD